MVAHQLAPGAVVGDGRFRVRREVNRGGTAVVYEAEDLHSRRRRLVALKVIHTFSALATPPGVAGPEHSVSREVAMATAAGAHPNIVKLLHVFSEEPACPFVLVWELIRGHDLLDLLNKCGNKFTEDTARVYFRQMVSAVAYLHDNNLCHRDIKPENFMVEASTDLVKLIDFGLSKHLDSVVTGNIGTPDYMAPELLTAPHPPRAPGEPPPYDARAVDAWSLGAVLYLMLTGTFPFEDPENLNNVKTTLENIKHARYQPIPPHVSAEAQDLIKGMLKRRPAKRLTLEAVATHPWTCGTPMSADWAPLRRRATPQQGLATVLEDDTEPADATNSVTSEALVAGGSARCVPSAGSRRISTLRKVATWVLSFGTKRSKSRSRSPRRQSEEIAGFCSRQ